MVSRRQFFRQFFGLAIDQARESRTARALVEAAETVRRRVEPAGAAADRRRTPPVRPVRPPGAGAEAEFLARCRGCLKECVAACPPRAIFLDAAGQARLEPARTPCDMCADLPCIAACPTGALEAPAGRWRIALVGVDEGACVNDEPGICDLCVGRCPVGAAALSWNAAGRPMVHQEHCTGCGHCVAVCPARPIALLLMPDWRRFAPAGRG